MPVLSNLIVRIGASTDDFDKQVDRALNKTKRLATTAVEAGTALAVGFSAPLIAAGAGALAAAANMESLEKGLAATMKSSAAAAAELQRLKEVSKLPGLGLQEAVQGSIRLQTLGNSADQSRRIMRELGNALAIVGGTKADFGEVIRQLSQMAAVGKVTKENLDPIVERIPQIAAIIKEKFGPAALGDPAKTFEKLGLSAKTAIEIIVGELEKGDRAGKTFSNSMENLRESAFETAAEFGKSLLPVAQAVLNDFLVPGVEKAKALADEFNGLSDSTKTLVIETTALLVAAPLVVTVIAKIAEKAILMGAALNKLWPIIKTVGVWLGNIATVILDGWTHLARFGAWVAETAAIIASKFWPAVDGLAERLANLAGKISVTGIATGAAGAAVAAFMKMLIDNRQNAVDTSAEALKRLNERVAIGTPAAFGAGSEAIMGYMRVLKPVSEENKKTGSSMADLMQKYRDGKITVEELGDGLRKLGEGIGKSSDAFAKATNVIKVTSVAGVEANGALSKSSLLYVETLERVKAAVSKVKDVMYDYMTAGSIYGKQIETHRSSLDNLSIATDDYRLALSRARFELEALNKMPPVQMAIPTQPTRKGTVFEADDILREVGGTSTRENAANIQALEAALARVKQLNQEGKATGNDVIAVQEALRKAQSKQTAEAVKGGKLQQAAMRQVSTVITDLSRGITDVIFKGGKLSEMFANVAKQAAQSITRLLIEGALTNLAKKIMNVGGLFGKVFGGSGGGVGLGAGMGDLGGAAKTGTNAATGAAGQAVSGITGIVGAIGSIGSMVSGIISNFQMMGMNKTLDLIEKEVRYSQIHLLAILEKGNEFWPYMKGCWESLIRMESRQMDLAANGGGGVSITINTTGDTRAILDALTRELKQLGVLPR